MEKLLKFSLSLLFLLASLYSEAQQVTIKSPVRFLALGDSYTIGQSVSETERWPVQLANQLINRGVEIQELKIIAQTGWRTDDLLDAIAHEKPDSNYNLVSVLIGVNNQYQGMDMNKYPDEFKQLLRKAIAFCGGNSNGVFVLSIPDYGFTPYGAGMRDFITAEINEYNRINREIAQEFGVTYFDVTPISLKSACLWSKCLINLL